MTVDYVEAPEKIKNNHITINKVWHLAAASLSLDEFERFEALLLTLCDRRNGLD